MRPPWHNEKPSSHAFMAAKTSTTATRLEHESIKTSFVPVYLPTPSPMNPSTSKKLYQHLKQQKTTLVRALLASLLLWTILIPPKPKPAKPIPTPPTPHTTPAKLWQTLLSQPTLHHVVLLSDGQQSQCCFRLNATQLLKTVNIISHFNPTKITLEKSKQPTIIKGCFWYE
jgi:hypothetical protein